MRVAINYRDGHYSLYDPTKRKFAEGVDPTEWMKENTVEISDRMWDDYLDHSEATKNWQERIRIIDEERT